jgi:undecaprenyl diphosphate synthase
VFNIALNYGGRDEILRSVKELMKECARDGRSPEDLTEDDISRHMYSGSAHFDVPDPDLIIRTSGEERMSNFLTWQAAYSELMFTDTLWPDFTPEEYAEMIDAYANRDRRFGGRKENDK